LFRARVRLSPGSIAFEDGIRTLTYAELGDRVNRTAQYLLKFGLQRGDRIAVLSENRLEYIEVELAAAKIGVIVACQNWRLAAPELQHCFDLVSPSLVISSKRHAHLLGNVDCRDARKLQFGAEFQREMLACSAEEPVNLVEPEDGLLILYTSGTTGLPKGALISHRAELARRSLRAAIWGLQPHEVWVIWTPLFHMSGTDDSISALLSGARIVMVDGFDISRIVSLVVERPLGWLRLMPGMMGPFIEQLKIANVTKPSVRMCGGLVDLLPPHQIAEVSGLLGAHFLNSFGSTEVGTILHGLLPPGEVPPDFSKEETTLAEVRLVDSSGADVADGVPGELAVRSATMFSGYWKMPELNVEEFRHGWFHMGDMFIRRANGRLQFVDRSKYLIKSGGENIYPAEIERVIGGDSRVEDVVVVRRKDAHWGEIPVAFVARKDRTLDADTLFQSCRMNLAGYKQPKEIYFVPESALPRSTTGKIQRQEVERWLTHTRIPSDDIT
jgi:fatty-acyl-CoA synthase